ncbi:MAG: caffeoyl-CoA O-methyltransferase [Acidimicrobiaceae bacterium]|jgi:caffeoyl-CoA O-methyltransferase
MTNPKSFQLSAEIHDYLIAHSTPADDIERALIEETAALGDIARMQIAPEQGALLRILTRLLGVTRAVEVGTFTGYSALCIARGLAPQGRLLCCDVSDEWTKIGRRHWEAAGVADRVELRLGPALDTLQSLPREATFDLAFIDADKPNYVAYYEELLPRMRVNGLLIVDNVLWSGSVVDPKANDENVQAIRAFNDHLAQDDRVEKVMLPVSDGITLARKH